MNITDYHKYLVGVTGIEPATSSSRTMRATRLRHTPTERYLHQRFSSLSLFNLSCMYNTPFFSSGGRVVIICGVGRLSKYSKRALLAFGNKKFRLFSIFYFVDFTSDSQIVGGEVHRNIFF